MKKFLLILVLLGTLSCQEQKVKIILPTGDTSISEIYTGKAVVKKISIEGDKYCYFVVTSIDLNKSEILFKTHDLTFNIDDTIYIDIKNGVAHNINDSIKTSKIYGNGEFY